MNTILWVFISLAAGVMLFAGLQENLPPELSFLKSTGETASPVTGKSVTRSGPWTITQAGSAIEFSSRLTGRIEVNGTANDTPEIGILCNEGKLDLRLDTRMATTGTRSTPISVSGLGESDWDKSATKNIFPRDPHQLLRLFAAGTPVSLTISYATLGKFTLQVETTDLPKLIARLPVSCQ